jgi:DNA repair exonuclease SbcCD ATPase subunit
MAKLIFPCKDANNKLVTVESSESEIDKLMDNYEAYDKVLGKHGLTRLSERKSSRPKEVVKFDGKTCPTCGSPVYDNRERKQNGEYKATAPDFACSNKACTGGRNGQKWAVWPDQYEITS